MFGRILRKTALVQSISTRKTMFRRFCYLAAIAITVTVSTSCGPETINEVAASRAVLNESSGEIDLPLEAYAMNSDEYRLVSHANAILVARCMQKTGRDFPRANQDWSKLTVFPDRRYGLWSMTEAEANGYEVAESSESQRVAQLEGGYAEDWWRAMYSCFDEVERLPLMGVNTTPSQPSSVDRGMLDSFNALIATDTFSEIRGFWRECIESKGISPDDSARVLVPKIPEPGESQIRIAIGDVECKQQHSVVQKLADAEAVIQAGYIRSHEAELVEYRKQADEIVAKARDIIASG